MPRRRPAWVPGAPMLPIPTTEAQLSAVHGAVPGQQRYLTTSTSESKTRTFFQFFWFSSMNCLWRGAS